MSIEPNETSKQRQPANGNNDNLNLTNSDATLARQTPKPADASLINVNATTATSDNLTQSVTNGSEINPEYGDSADPTFETI